MNKFRKIALFSLSIFTAVSISSCSSDDDTGGDNNGGEQNKPYVLSMAIQGSEGDFTYYTVPFADVMTGTLSAVGQGLEQPGYYDFTKIDNTIYSIGGLDDVNVVAINKNEDQTLSQTGNVSFANSLSDIVEGDENTLISVSLDRDSDVITFRTFNKNTVSVSSTKEVPVSQITDLVGPSYSGMRVSGDYLFLSYYISDSAFDTNYTDQAEVAVFSYPELEFQNVITDDRVGPIGGFNVKSGLIKDENGNVYAVSHSNPANGFSQSTKLSGILKINSGETQFDQDFFFDIESVTGGKNAAHLKYLGNGKVFAEINMVERAAQERWSDGPLQSAVLDLNANSVNYFNGIPEHNGSGRRLSALQEGNNVYVTIPEDTGIYVYKLDTQNFTATKGAKVEATFAAGIFKL